MPYLQYHDQQVDIHAVLFRILSWDQANHFCDLWDNVQKQRTILLRTLVKIDLEFHVDQSECLIIPIS